MYLQNVINEIMDNAKADDGQIVNETFGDKIHTMDDLIAFDDFAREVKMVVEEFNCRNCFNGFMNINILLRHQYLNTKVLDFPVYSVSIRQK